MQSIFHHGHAIWWISTTLRPISKTFVIRNFDIFEEPSIAKFHYWLWRLMNVTKNHSCSRYLAVTQPLVYSRRRRSKRLAGLMIVAVWILAGIITSPPLLGCFPRATNRDREKCGYNMDSSYVVFSSMGSFFLPMLVMIYVYARISCVIARRHKSLQGPADAQNDYGSHRGKTPVAISRERSKSCFTQAATTSKRSEELSSVSDIGPGSSSEKIAEQRALPTDLTTAPSAGSSGKKTLLAVPSRNQQPRGSHQSSINRVTRETKTAGTLAVVVGGFIACWLPFFVLYLATPFIPVEPPDSLMSALTWLGTYNHSILLKHQLPLHSTDYFVHLNFGTSLPDPSNCAGLESSLTLKVINRSPQ